MDSEYRSNFSPSQLFSIDKIHRKLRRQNLPAIISLCTCCFNSIFALFLKAGVFIVPATISTPRLLGSPSISFEEKNEPFFRSSSIISKNTPEQQCHIYDNKQTDTPSGLGFIYRIINSLRSEPVTQQTRRTINLYNSENRVRRIEQRCLLTHLLSAVLCRCTLFTQVI